VNPFSLSSHDAEDSAKKAHNPAVGPLLTLKVCDAMRAALQSGRSTIECSLDLDRSRVVVDVAETGWTWKGQRYAHVAKPKERTVYHWTGEGFEPVARYSGSLIKLVPTEWGPPTFEIDGVKMLPTSKVSPFQDAERKVALIEPRGKRILDTCGGLGYFAEWCVRGQAAEVRSFEKNADVIWLRSLNPWSPHSGRGLTLTEGDIEQHIGTFADESFDAVLHDPPRFGTAGELYSEAFYQQLARVMKRKGRLYHYTGAPNRLTTGRDVRKEVATRLERVGFVTQLDPDGVLAIR
jgi:predicted methyltransferase